jgi:hypothetical protein
MTTVAVATYNMSFASDSGLDPDGNGNFASEAAFLKSIPKEKNSIDRRAFWKNAMKIVEKFWTEVPNAGVMGFQELNKTEEGMSTGSAVLAGFAKEKGLAFAVDEVVTPFSKPALGLLWNPKYFGEYKTHVIKDLTHPLTEIGNTKGQVGRPILVVQTTKGFVLVVLHGPNSEPASRKTQKDLKDAIKAIVESSAPDATADKIFIMGDFNDRYDAITAIDVANGTLRYEGKAPLSCCHNWDSSCSDERYESLDAALGRTKVGTCKVPNYPDGFTNTKGSTTKKVPTNQKNANGKPVMRNAAYSEFTYQLAGPGPRVEMGSEGNIENYRYYGDKVFGAKPVSNIQMYPPGRTGASKESDHEMVMAEYEIPMGMEGGRRRGKKHTRKAKHHKKGTRKH